LLDGPQQHPRFGAHYRELAELARRNQQCPGPAKAPQVAGSSGRQAAASFGNLFRGAYADIEAIRAATALPETADELCDVARMLGVPESDILLGSRATKAALKDFSDNGQLANYRIVHFATHGVLAGEVKGSAEPGLILTPPARGTRDLNLLDRDDGFLTSSEISTLKLDSDWVILSACNTAGNAGGTEVALSGIASAFFYAGARALLVSHWEVASDAAVKLTTRALARPELRTIGRAEAFRISTRELLETGSTAQAHPSAWAPFVIVGESGAPAIPLGVSSPVVSDERTKAKKARHPTRKKVSAEVPKVPDWRAELWRQ
jgi:CHAT domain-containing protein